MKTRWVVLAAAVALQFSPYLWAQGGPASSSGGAAASQGSATIETQMITYEVLRQMAGTIAGRVPKACQCRTVLLPDANSQLEVTTAKGFGVSVDTLVHAYENVAVKDGANTPHFILGVSDINGLLTTIKSSATYSNQNFQPTPQSMITLLSIALNAKNVAVRTANLPGNLDKAVAEVQAEVGKIETAQKDAKARIEGKQKQEDDIEAERRSKDKDKDKATKDQESAAHKAALAEIAADKAALSDLDKEFSGMRTALGGTSPDGTVLATIIKGDALLQSAPYSMLTVSVDAAGGDMKVRHLFWQELIMPTPTPSYNGGAVVSYLLTDQNAKFQDGELFHYMYGWSKYDNRRMPNLFDPPKE